MNMLTDTSSSGELRFTHDLLQRPSPSGIDAVTTLRHFALINYAVAPQLVRPHVHPRFDLDCFSGPDDSPRVWVSVVPFEDQDFRFFRFPWLRFHFGQTNYRTYVVDRLTGRRAVWFFGTTLGSPTVLLPRYVWRLPWHYGRFRFDCAFDDATRKYSHYRVTTASKWAPLQLALEDSGEPVAELDGFPDLEAGLVTLTHPLAGVYYRRDGQVGTYSVWHDRLRSTIGHCQNAQIGLLDRLGLVSYAEQQRPHSVLIQHETEFIIHLPPSRAAMNSL